MKSLKQLKKPKETAVIESRSPADLENTLFVNAWDPWSLIGNGNERDNSLDGWWGRVSNMAILGWLPTNPSIKFYPVTFSMVHLEAMP